MLKKSILSGFVATGALLTASSAGAVGAVSTEFLNMRTAPTVHGAKIEVIPSGAALDVNHCLANRPWCAVSYRGQNGWASARFIDTKNPRSIPIVKETVHPVSQKIHYQTTTPIMEPSNVSYTKPVIAQPYQTTYVPATKSQDTHSGFLNAIEAPFKVAEHIVAAPFTALEGHQQSNNVSAPTGYQTRYATTTSKVSYPSNIKAKRIIIEQQLPPVYVKEKDLGKYNIQPSSYMPTNSVTSKQVMVQPQIQSKVYVQPQKPVTKVSYIAHPTVNHVAVEAPKVNHTAYVEKAPIQKVVYHKQPVSVSRQLVLTPKSKVADNQVKTVSYKTVKPVNYQQTSVIPSQKIMPKPLEKEVIYQKTTTTTTKPMMDHSIKNVLAPAGRFDMREAQKTTINYGPKSILDKKIEAYNPMQTEKTVHMDDFNRNETRYDLIK